MTTIGTEYDLARDGFAVHRGVLDPAYVATLAAVWDRERDRTYRQERFVFTPPEEIRALASALDVLLVVNAHRPSWVAWSSCESCGGKGRHYSDSYGTECDACMGGVAPTAPVALNRMLVKDERWTDAVHCHQDPPYFEGPADAPTPDGVEKLNVFVPLRGMDEGNGGLVLYAGSHRSGWMGRGTLEPHARGYAAVVPTVAAGDVLVCDWFLWHSSLPTRDAARVNRPLVQLTFAQTMPKNFNGGRY